MRDAKGKFVKGESGNAGGRPKTKIFRNALLKKLEKKGELENIINSLLEAASKGSVQAIKEIREIIDGKTFEIKGDNEQPLIPDKIIIKWDDDITAK